MPIDTSISETFDGTGIFSFASSIDTHFSSIASRAISIASFKSFPSVKISISGTSTNTALFVLVKLIGNREMSQMSMFDYVNSITIGSIAAELATCEKWEFTAPLTAMIVYSLVMIALASISNKSLSVRRFVEGKALVLMDNGKINYSNLSHARIDINEFLMMCRVNGYFNIDDIQTAVLEANGKISVLPKSTVRPVNPKDLKLTPNMEKLVINLVIDGKILEGNLKVSGNSPAWLNTELKLNGVKELSEVLLATCDAKNKLKVYKKYEMEKNTDEFNI